MKADLDGGVEHEIQPPDLELTAIQKDTEIRLLPQQGLVVLVVYQTVVVGTL